MPHGELSAPRPTARIPGAPVRHPEIACPRSWTEFGRPEPGYKTDIPVFMCFPSTIALLARAVHLRWVHEV